MIHHVGSALSPIAAERILFACTLARLGACLEESRFSLANEPVARVTRHVRLCEAVYQNARLWIALQDSLLDCDNRLPPDLRTRLIALGSVAKKSGFNALRDARSLLLLIDIDRAIFDGLGDADASGSAADAAAGMPEGAGIDEPRGAVVDLAGARRKRQAT